VPWFEWNGAEKNPETTNRLGDELGRMVFGGRCRKSRRAEYAPRGESRRLTLVD
jgi:hypothetical protein